MDEQTALPQPADPASVPPRAEVLHDGRIAADDEEVILAALTECGVAAELKIIPARRDAQALAWLVLISLPLQGFMTAVGTKIAEDAYGKFIQAARRLLDRRRHPADTPEAEVPPVLVLQDPATGLRIVFEPDLPGEAYEQLPGLDLAGYRYGPVHYDRSLRRWRSELDEADRARTSLPARTLPICVHAAERRGHEIRRSVLQQYPAVHAIEVDVHGPHR
jgi:hypothetical protein